MEVLEELQQEISPMAIPSEQVIESVRFMADPEDLRREDLARRLVTGVEQLHQGADQ